MGSVRRYGDFDADGVLLRWLTACLGSGRCGVELGRPIAICRTGAARRRLIDKAVCPGQRDGEHGHGRSRAGEAEVQYWNVAANLH
jgi:hypothetical protein